MSEKRPLSLAFPRGESLPVWAFLFSGLIASFLGIGSVLMMTSAFLIEVDSFGFVFFLPLFAFGFSYIHALRDNRLTWITVGGLAFLITISMYLDIMSVRESAMSFITTLQSSVLDSWTGGSVNPFTMTLFFVLVSTIPAFLTTWVIMRGKNIAPALIGYLPFWLIAFSINFRSPTTFSCVITMLGVLMLFLFQTVRKTAKETTFQRLLILMMPFLVLLIVFSVLHPQKKYREYERAQKHYETVEKWIDKISSYFSWGTRASRETRALAEATYSGSVVIDDEANHILRMYVDNENLLNVGNFNPPKWKFMTVVREKNNRYIGSTPMGNHYLYLKTSSMSRFDGVSWAVSSQDLSLSDYFPSKDVAEKEAGFTLRISSDFAGKYAFIPNYVDLYHVDPDSNVYVSDSEPAVRESYNMNEKILLDNPSKEYLYAYNDVPVRYTPKWSDTYLDQIYSECTSVPDGTRERLLYSNILPDWYMDLLSGKVEWPTDKIVQNVIEYVSGLHPYDPDTGFPPEKEDFVFWFVTSCESGFCVHYATTTAVLLRLLGIPTRYVKGYFLTDVENGQECEVFSTDAHAWIEYFHPDYGWVMDDPTPPNRIAASYYNFDAIVREYGPTTTMVTPRPRAITPPPVSASSDGSGSKSTTTDDSWESKHYVPQQSYANKIFDRVYKITIWLLILAGIVVVLTLLTRFLFQHYWKKRFRSKDTNIGTRAYFNYYLTMAGLLKGSASEGGESIAQKATFSRTGITREELLEMIQKEEKNLDALYAKASANRRRLFDIYEIRKKLPL